MFIGLPGKGGAVVPQEGATDPVELPVLERPHVELALELELELLDPVPTIPVVLVPVPTMPVELELLPEVELELLPEDEPEELDELEELELLDELELLEELVLVLVEL